MNSQLPCPLQFPKQDSKRFGQPQKSEINLKLDKINQEQEQEDQKKEQILLEIIVKFQRLIDQFNQNKKQNMSVVLLVGVTGSGKSIIFNFQSGADFIFNQSNQLEIKNHSNNFSKMGAGMNSITKEPNFYHNQKNNHLIIDFPGFQDTKGEQDQLLFELLFHKIVTSGPMKIIYVIKNLEGNLSNRGSDLQEFINQLSKKGNFNIEKFNLLLNCYREELSDEKLKIKIQEDLKSVNLLQSIDKILILRKAKKDHELQQIFNEYQRQIFWKNIEQMQSMKIQPQKLPKSQIISDYLRNRILKTIEKYCVALSQFFDNTLKILSKQQVEAIMKQMGKLLDLVNKIDKESSFEWYTNYIQTCEQLAKVLSIQHDIITRSNNFIKIYKYYSQFCNLIQGYEDLKILQIIAKDQLKNMNNYISMNLELLKTKQNFDSRITQLEEDKQQLKSKMSEQDIKIKNYQFQINHLEASNSQVKDLYIQLEKEKKIKSSLNDQIIEFQNTINSMNENFQETINKLSNQIRFLQNREPEVITKWICQIF
ncbi:unnamed protein product [Paramecium sonneborni]|uniref:G domain-containing protein n=1 Tax=Paramecium sonneborni TaxID=65129 RepID=A0A8S1PIU4_9CILI|nr:unnamed protein product [Paramecium sonneborni]